MHSKTWVVVANSSNARIFKANSNKQLEELGQLDHPESRAQGKDLISDKPSSGFSRSGGATSHGTTERNEAKKQEASRFASEVADKLQASFQSGEFEHLYLVAGPQFLGMLTETMNPTLLKAVLDKVPKDLTSQKVEQIREHLPFVL